jgi:hypothetical protein
MIIAELAKFNEIPDGEPTPVSPFVYVYYPFPKQEASFMSGVFGLTSQVTDERTFVKGVYVDVINAYTETSSLSLCEAQAESWFWDDDAQALYIHVAHSVYIDDSDFSYISVVGFSDESVVYINDNKYLPYISGFPSIQKKADLQNYPKLTFNSGTISLNNIAGNLDYLIDQNINGYNVWTYYLESGHTSYSRDDLNALAVYVVKDLDISTETIDIRLKDPRESQNADILNTTLSQADYPDLEDEYNGTTVPLAYGNNIRGATAIPVNGAAGAGNDVTYIVAKEVSSFGTAQVRKNDVWTNVTITSSNTSNGTFTVAEAESRDSTSGNPLQARVVGFNGKTITYLTDIIKELNNDILDVGYNSDNYDTTNWAANETTVGTGCVVFDREIKLYEAIRIIQDGALVNFRYDIDADGKRRLLVDDTTKVSSDHAYKEEILNIDKLKVRTDDRLLAAIVRCKYSKDYSSGKYIAVTNTTYSTEVQKNYRQKKTATLETLLNNKSDAETKALNYITRYKEIPKEIEIITMGSRFFYKNIYDIITVEIVPGFVDRDASSISGRNFYGVWKAQILAVRPDTRQKTTRINVALLSKEF